MSPENILAELELLLVDIRVEDNNLKLSGNVDALSKDLMAELKSHKSALIALLESIEKQPPIPMKNMEIQEYYDVSNAQKRLWYSTQNDSAAQAYNQPLVFEVKGNLNAKALQQAINGLINRHEILRTTFHLLDGQIKQKIHRQYIYEIKQHKNVDETLINEYFLDNVNYVFHTEKLPLFKFELLESNTRKQYLIINMHHIISDGWSVAIFLNELREYYNAEIQHTCVSLPELEIQYKEFVQWQQKYLDSPKARIDEAFWMKKLEQNDNRNAIPTDRLRVSNSTYSGDNIFHVFASDTIKNIDEFCKTHHLSRYMFFSGILSLLIHKYSNADNILFGSPIVNRSSALLENQIGCYINTILIPVQIDKNMSIDQYFEIQRENILRNFKHKDYPYDLLTEKYSQNNKRTKQLLNTILTLQNYDAPVFRLNEEVIMEEVAIPKKKSMFDLTFRIFENNAQLKLELEYSTDLFDYSTAERIIRHYVRLCDVIMNYTTIPIHELQIITDDEFDRIRKSMNNSDYNYPKHDTIISLFDQIVKKYSDNIAVKGENEYTYKELDKKANLLANDLIEKYSINIEDKVALSVQRNEYVVIGILAILKAGAAYVPIDKLYPKARKQYIFNDSNCKLIISDSDEMYSIPKININEYKTPLGLCNGSEKADERLRKLKPENLAYIMYTSGSTGNPKGVMIEHKNVVRLFYHDKPLFDFNHSDVWTMFHSYSFDFSVWEIFGALLFGGKVIVLNSDSIKDPDEYLTILRNEKVTVVNQTPTAFYNLQLSLQKSEAKGLFVRYIIFGGEALHTDRIKYWKKLLPNCKLINMYGITEGTVHVTYKELSKTDLNSQKSNIGKPIPGMQLHILDADMNHVPFGIQGELYFAGDGLARGYHNNHELTRQRFVTIKSYFDKEIRAYKTGDIVCINIDGDLEYFGRIDRQVQYHGFRVELTEIEHHLRNYPLIDESVIQFVDTDQQPHEIVAYYVAESDIQNDQIIDFLKNQLPTYMVPARFIRIESIPITPNGKIDYHELAKHISVSEHTVNKSLNPIQAALAKIWENNLQTAISDLDVSYFNVGGDSIKAISLISEINKTCKSNLKVAHIYEYDTILSLEKYITENVTVEEPQDHIINTFNEIENTIRETLPEDEEIESIFPLSDVESGMLYYSLSSTDQTIYHDQFVYQVDIQNYDHRVMTEAMDMLIKKHQILRTSFNISEYFEPVHFIHRNIRYDFEYSDLTSYDSNTQTEKILAYLNEDLNKPFDFLKPPLWRIKVCDLSDSKKCFLWSFHHAILDGWSNASLFTELFNTYSTIKKSGSFKVEPLKSNYRDYVIEQYALKKNKQLREFWSNELEDHQRLQLPFVKRDSGSNQNIITDKYLSFDEENKYKIENVLNTLKIDLTSLFMACYIYAINMIVFEKDILVGFVTHSRHSNQDAQKVLGCFLNSLPFRFIIDVAETWAEFVLRISKKLKEIKRNAHLPFSEIIALSDISTNKANPLFDTAFGFVDFHVYNEIIPDSAEGAIKQSNNPLPIEGYEKTNTILNVIAGATKGKMQVKFSYNAGYFEEHVIQQFISLYENILNSILSFHDKTISNLDVLTAYDKERLIKLNRTKVPYPGVSIQDLILEQSSQHSNKTALRSNEKTVTYNQLEEEAKYIATYIINKGIGKDDIVAVYTEQSIETIIAFYGILKAGAAFLPISVKTPPGRIKKILDDSGAKLILTTEDTEQNSILDFDNKYFIKISNENKSEPLKRKYHAKDIAYVMYTSGSTGQPKGVMLSNNALVNLSIWTKKYYSISSDDTTSKYLDIGFDGSIVEIFPFLISGATITIIPEEIRLDIPALNKYFESNNISTAVLPTPIAEQFMKLRNKSLRFLIIGGDALRSFEPQAYQVYNNYGPTENTVITTVYRVTENSQSIPIGKPIDNVRVYILDKNSDQLLPVGITGELCIAGESLAEGYLNDKSLTSEKFISIPYLGEKRVYRTGDLASIDEKNDLRFKGRVDQQVQVYGNRIEIGEIEHAILQNPDIKDAVVLPHTDEDNNTSLAAYLVYQENEITETSIKEYLKQSIPDYMIPAKFYALQSLPYTKAGKIDKKTLRRNKKEEKVSIEKSHEGIIKNLVKIWADVLQVNKEQIDTDKNFFDLGGNSIKLMKVHAEINKITTDSVPIVDLFKHTTIETLAKYLDRSTNEEKLSGFLQTKKKQKETDIAIIGMSGKFPGALSVKEFEKNLYAGIESITFFSEDELRNAGVPEHLLDDQNFIPAAGILSEWENFDAPFFGFTPQEAAILDPQIRVLFEIVWNALENANYQSKQNLTVGLFIGASKNTYWENAVSAKSERFDVDPFIAALFSNRENIATLISYKLNLSGPSVYVHTACSTSLVAVHQAVTALRNGECDIAIAGGVNLSLPVIGGTYVNDGSVFSSDGHCRPFDINSSGTVAGKGAAVVVLTPLVFAENNSHFIHAVIKGSAVNNDGSNKIGYTAPSVEGQFSLFQKAYQDADVEPSTLSFIEGHGTGTELGDPIEIEALSRYFASSTNQYCYLSSVKSNIGHPDTAAGVVGLIKATIALKKKLLPPTIHYNTPNETINLHSTPFKVNNSVVPLLSDKHPLRAGVSSFGIGGTNAHIVLEEYPETTLQPNEEISEDHYYLFPLSAKSRSALENKAHELKHWINENHKIPLNRLSYTLQNNREEFRYRATIVSSHIDELAQKLNSISIASSEKRNIIFVFPGQGGQYVKMGQGLYLQYPFFKKQIDECLTILKKLSGLDFSSYFFNDSKEHPKSIHQTEITHPVLFSFTYALAKFLIHLGIKPTAMIGHSMGQYVAACISGVFSLEDTLLLMLERGKGTATVKGLMLSVSESDEFINQLIDSGSFNVSIAAINSNNHFILSGAEKDIKSCKESLDKKEIKNTLLHVSFASHCSLMETIISDYKKALNKVIFNIPQIPFYCNITGKRIDKKQVQSAEYWCDHLLKTVMFSANITNALKDYDNAYLLEVGPGQAMSSAIKEQLGQEHVLVTNTMKSHSEEINDVEYFLRKLGLIWSNGVSIEWNLLHKHKCAPVAIPEYPFDKIKFPVQKILSYYNSDSLTDNSSVRTMEQWFSTPLWKEYYASLATTSALKEVYDSFIIFNDNSDFTKYFTTVNEEFECQLISFTDTESGTYLDSLSKYLEAKTNTDKKTLILFLWNNLLGKEKQGIHPGFQLIIKLTRFLKKHNYFTNVDICVITQELYNVIGIEENNSLAQQAILGAIKVIPQEYREASIFHLDIMKNSFDEKSIRLITSTILGYADNRINYQSVALRNHKIWVQTYDNYIKPGTSAHSIVKEKGTYLITGGLGNLGFILANYLVQSFSANLIILGKTNLEENTEIANLKNKKLLMLRSSRTQVDYYSVDLSNERSIQETLKELGSCVSVIDGVFHTAANTNDKIISCEVDNITVQQIIDQFTIKIQSILLIKEFTDIYNPDFYLLYSSVSSVLGGLGYLVYSAANTVLNKIAQRFRNEKTIWISAIWDGWNTDNKQHYYDSTFNVRQGQNALKILFQINNVENIIISKRNITHEIEKWVNIENYEVMETNLTETEYLYDRPQLSTSYNAPNNDLEKKIVEIWQHFFGIKQIGTLDHFYELGGDSLKATTMISLLHKKLNTSVSLEYFLKNPTIKNISIYVEEHSDVKNEITIEPVSNENEIYPLSSAQKRLFILNQIENKSTNYNINSAVQFSGSLNIDRLHNAFESLIKRHESLRTIFTIIDNTPVQRVLSSDDVIFRIETVSDEATFFRPFDLDSAPLMRIGIKTISATKHILFIDVHHIIADAISMHIIFDEIALLYKGEQLPELSLHYKDFAVFQNNNVHKHSTEPKKTYWLSQFGDEIPVLNFPSDYKRPAVQQYEGDVHRIQLDESLTASLLQLSKSESTTLYNVLFAAFNVLLFHYTGQKDIVVGTTTAGRNHIDIQGVIGMFANTLPIRTKPEPLKVFSEYIHEVEEISNNAIQNQDFQFEDLVEALNIDRDVSRNPLFDFMFVFISLDRGEVTMPSLSIEPYTLKKNVSQFDMTLHCNLEKGNLYLTFEYATSLFRKETIKQFADHFINVLAAIGRKPSERITSINFISDEERKEIHNISNGETITHSKDNNIVSLFTEQAKKTPHKKACIDRNTGDTLTYNQFHTATDTIAKYLIKKYKIKPGGMIGLMTDRNKNMLLSVMGILKTGNAYVPTDPDVPNERSKYIFEDSKCDIILVERKYYNQVKAYFKKTILIIETLLENTEQNDDPLFPFDGSAPAFLLYTSGSTGKPKGVKMPHSPLVNLMQWTNSKYPITENDVILLLNPITFDMSIWGLYAWALFGASASILENNLEMDPEAICEAITKDAVTVLHLVPSMLQMILEYYENRQVKPNTSSVKYIFVSGEALTPAHIYKFENTIGQNGKTKLINFYGPTEAHVVSYFNTDQYDEHKYQSVPIGKPIANAAMYIVNPLTNQLVPKGVIGELFLGGACLADEYFNRQSLTNEKFRKDVAEHIGFDGRLYKTGDLARWLPDNNMEFLGRTDHLIKIRGFRVEPGEIENSIMKWGNIKETLVITSKVATGELRLVAYIVPKNSEISIDKLRSYLKEQLPDYMVPSFIIQLKTFPLNPNGKIDRKKLPKPADKRRSDQLILPKNHIEKILAETWSEVLETDVIDTNDNFFDIGGHSLLLIRVHNLLKTRIETNISVVDLFRYPTIISMSEFILGKADNNDTIVNEIDERNKKRKDARLKRIQDRNRRNKNGK